MSFSPQPAGRNGNNLTPQQNFQNVRRDPSPNSRPRRATQFNGEATSMPLLDTETVNTAGPPLAGPETDNDSDDRETINKSYPGVDDGFFPNANPNNPGVEIKPRANVPEPAAPANPSIPPASEFPESGRFPARNPNSPFPYAPGFGLEMPEYAPTEFGPNGETIPDVNIYQHKKTMAQGMMDIALFSANANQLRYVLESYDRHPYYLASVTLISMSLIIQVAVGCGLIWNAHYNVKDKKEICIANKISNMTIIGIFIVTVVNVFISAFGVATAAPSTAVAVVGSA